MQKCLLVTSLTILITVGMIILFESPRLVDNQLSATSRNEAGTFDDVAIEATCLSSGEISFSCEEIAQRILSTTVRIEIETWIVYVEGEGYASLRSDGHGTVMNGRYLLTHNHFDLPLSDLLADDFNGQFATITLYTANGSPLWRGPLTTAGIVFDDSETLLLELLDRHGEGLFDSLGIPSADFATRETVHVTPGATVAQVNWNGAHAFVQWTHVEDVFTEAGTPVVQLADCIRGGSSGGGVFFEGKHIANNWSRSNGCVEQSRLELLLYSKAALNSTDLIAVGRPHTVIVSTH